MNMRKIALGLGWFGIGLGVAELLAGGRMSRVLGLGDRSALVRVFGLREIASGIGILAAQKRGPWVWARVAGDALDLAVLGLALRDKQHRKAAALATGSVAAVSALDVLCGQRLGTSA